MTVFEFCAAGGGFSTLNRVERIGTIASDFMATCECWFQYPQSGRTHWNDVRSRRDPEVQMSFSTLNRVERIGTLSFMTVSTCAARVSVPSIGSNALEQ